MMVASSTLASWKTTPLPINSFVDSESVLTVFEFSRIRPLLLFDLLNSHHPPLPLFSLLARFLVLEFFWGSWVFFVFFFTRCFSEVIFPSHTSSQSMSSALRL